MNKSHYFILIALSLLLTACEHSAHTRTDQLSSLHSPTLPIDSTHWTTWRCTNGDTFSTRYRDHRATEITLRRHDTTQTLQHQLGINPVIYSNDTLAFYSDGYYASIGRPLSDKVISGGCTVQH